MIYFNNFILNESHVEHFNFPELFISESKVNSVTENLRLGLREIIRKAFEVTCNNVENMNPDMLDIDEIYIDFNYTADEKEYDFFESLIRKFKNKDRLFYKLRLEIDYNVIVKENVNRNYLKLKDYELYNRVYSKDFNALMYINFYTILGDVLYRWASENDITMRNKSIYV